MSLSVNTYILKGIDSDQTNLVSSTLEYISAIKKISNTVGIVENLNINLQKNDFLIIIIDFLLLEQITQNSLSVDFFKRKNFQSNQIILILDDLNTSDLPEYLQNYQTFLSYNNNNEEWDVEVDTKINLTDIVDDVVLYIDKVNLGKTKDRLTIYLGPADDNTTIEYQKITRELLHRDYNILPEISNPIAKDLLNDEGYLLKMIEVSDLAIHFIGHNSILDYPNSSSPAIKINNIAVDYCEKLRGKNLQRIVYVPSEKGILNDVLDQKIQQFKSDSKILLNAELIQTSVEKFKEVVLRKLEDIANPIEDKINIERINSGVYFIYPPGKESEIKIYTDWFGKNNIEYAKSQIDLDQLELINYHKTQLTTCSSVIIYNSGNTEWLNRKISDIKKSPGWGRKQPFKVKAICGVKPDNIRLDKTSIDSFSVINNCDDFNKIQMKNLLTD